MIGTEISGRYLIEAELGRGGMGVVYRGRDLLLKRPVAVKVVGSGQLGSEGRARLLREAQAAASLNQPNIVAIYDAGETTLPGQDEPATFVVMEFVEGQTLRDYRPADVAESVTILQQICAALEAAHAQGIIHRDLKAENVIRAADGLVKLMDFGLARTLGRTRLTQEGTFMGTFDYLAPELIQGREASVQSDLYALGVLAYELLAGRRPFAADTPAGVLAQHLHAPPTPPSAFSEAIPAALEHLVIRLLSKRPEDRPPSAAAVAQDLLDITQAVPDSRSPLPGPRLDFLVRGRLVGRQRELAQAMNIWGRAAAGQRQVLLISGEPGIGKTRLASEIAAQAQLAGARLLKGQCYEHGGLPYMPLAQMIRAVADEEALAALADADRANLVRMAPDLARLWPDAEPEQDTIQEDEESRFLESIVALCQLLVNQRPLLLFLDDLHWVDSGTIAAIRHLARRLPAAPLILLATYREIELAGRRPVRALLEDLHRETGAVRLKLGRLDRSGTEALLATLFAEEVTAEFLEAIYGETEGNPFFVEELCKALVASGQLRLEGGRWQRPAMDEIRLPQSIQLAISGRLERLDDRALEYLQAAAMLGREFGYDLLRTAVQAPETALVTALDEAMKAQLIQERRRRAESLSPEVSFSFTHALIQATLLDSLGMLRRQLLAGRLARALAASADEEAGLASLLGRLYSEAGEGQKAVPYLLQAADQARRLFAHEEAIDNYEQALLYLRQGNDLDHTARTLMTVGALLLKMGHFERSSQAYDEAFALWQLAPQQRDDMDGTRQASRAFKTHTNEPLSLDPTRAIDTASDYVIRQIFEGLVDLGAEGDILPAAAYKWEILDGGYRYVFHLREDAFWSNGEPVVAADFEYAWKRALEPDVDTRLAYIFYDIRGARDYHMGLQRAAGQIGIRAEDQRTLVVELERPVAYILHLLTSMNACPVPHELVEAYGDGWSEPERIVTNGPFRLSSWERSEQIVLTRNERYTGRFSGNLVRVELSLKTDEALLEAYGEGRLDCLYPSLLPGQIANSAIRRFERDLLAMPSPIISYLAFNCGQGPFRNRRLRQAVNLCIDRRQLVDVRAGWSDPALRGLVPRTMLGHGLAPEHAPDPEGARRLLAEAGHLDGRDLPRLTFLAITQKPSKKTNGYWLAAQMRNKLGLDIELHQLPLPELMSRLEDGRPDLLYLAWGADYPDADSVLRGPGWPEACNWSNDQFAELVEDARTETNQAARFSLYRQAEELLAREAPLVPLSHFRWQILIQPWVQRFATSPAVWTILRDVVLDDENREVSERLRIEG